MFILNKINKKSMKGKSLDEQVEFYWRLEKHGRSPSQPTKTKIQKHMLSTRVPTECESKIKIMMEEFMNQIKTLISQFRVIDYYYVLGVLRQHDFFSDVATHISANLVQKLKHIQEEITKTEHQALQKKVQKSQPAVLLKKETPTKIHMNPSKSIPSNLYYFARSCTEEEFVNYYNKITPNHQITLKNIQKEPSNQKQTSLQNLSKQKYHNNTEHLQDKDLKMEQNTYKHLYYDEKNLEPDQEIQKRPNLLGSSLSRNQRKNVYRNDKSEEYFSRYYRTGNFNVKGIVSVERTKMEEMEKLQSEYKKNMKKKQKLELYKQHRYHHSYASNT